MQGPSQGAMQSPSQGAMQSPSQGAMQGHFQGAMKGHFQGANHQPKNVQQSMAPRREVRKIIERIESLVATHHFSEEIAKLVMRLLAILKIGCNSEDDSILRVVHMIVSIVCIGYHKISKIFATMSVSELSFHELMMLFRRRVQSIVNYCANHLSYSLS